MNNIVTGKVRFSYANVFEPRAMQNGGDPKYSITLLIPKNDSETYQKIIAEINRTLEESIADTFKGVRPANPRLPIYDGDGIRESGEPFGPECKGCWVISAKSNTAPEVVDANCQPILSKNEFYSGCYGRASIRFYAYNQNGNKGIGCGLGNVQKLEDGQPLDRSYNCSRRLWNTSRANNIPNTNATTNPISTTIPTSTCRTYTTTKSTYERTD